ncbi:hypothetical protein ACNKHP_09180 [Shigella boydii]
MQRRAATGSDFSALEKRGIYLKIGTPSSTSKPRELPAGRLQQVWKTICGNIGPKQTQEEVLNHLFANEDFDRYYRQTLLAVKKQYALTATACGSSVNLSRPIISD